MSRHIVTDGETKTLQAERLYCVTDKRGEEFYAWSPDGEGCYWYDTLEEAFEQHGRLPVYHIDEITDF